MITVETAKNIIKSNALPAAPVQLPLENAIGLVLAADLHAALDIPAFPQSSMDGYAIRFSDLQQNMSLAIAGEIPAGAAETKALAPGLAARIFTGAPVPPGADTVVMQEKVVVDNGRLVVKDEKLQLGMNVRPAGAEIKSDTLALEAGSVLTPAAVGFLAGTGISSVSVYPLPAVAIIVTGNELQQPGKPLAYGQVYESNSYALRAVLKQFGLREPTLYQAADNIDTLQQVLQHALDHHDMVLLTGGVSVGDYDFVTKAAGQCGVSVLFHRIKQRPGKPLYFGRKDNKLVFGLPGNPASVLTCFYQYVTEALSGIAGKPLMPGLQWLPMDGDFRKDKGLTHFLRARYDGKSAKPFPAQESFRMHAFARANCLMEIDEETTAVENGTLVKTYLLPT